MRLRTAVYVPSARSEGLLVERVGDETVVYDRDTKQAHCLKPLAALVFERSDGQATVEQIAATASERLGVDVTEAEVNEAVSQLEERRLLDAPLVVHQNGAKAERNGFSRREMVRRTAFAGVASAVAGSLVTTIGTVPAFAQGSQLATGCTGCTDNHSCVSNHCCQSVAGKSCNESCCVGANNSCHITSTGNCTVVQSTGCPCICGAPGCTGPCCPPPSSSCCTATCTGTGQGTCSAGLTCCSGNCFDLQADFFNCGSCGHACTGNQACVNGTCQ